MPIRTPLLNHVDGVFLHVRDLRQAATWYSAAFGLPLKENELARNYYTLNGTGHRPWITLDAHAADPDFVFQPAAHPVCAFVATDLSAAYRHLQQLGAHMVGDIQHVHPGLSCFTCRDPDGNALMVIQRG